MASEGVDLDNFNFPYNQIDFSHLNFQSEWRHVFIFFMHELIHMKNSSY